MGEDMGESMGEEREKGGSELEVSRATGELASANARNSHRPNAIFLFEIRQNKDRVEGLNG